VDEKIEEEENKEEKYEVDCYDTEDDGIHYAFEFNSDDELVSFIEFGIFELDEDSDIVEAMIWANEAVYNNTSFVGLKHVSYGAEVDADELVVTTVVKIGKLDEEANLDAFVESTPIYADFGGADAYTREAIADAMDGYAVVVDFEDYELPELCDGELPDEDFCYLCISTDKELCFDKSIGEDVCADCYELLDENGYHTEEKGFECANCDQYFEDKPHFLSGYSVCSDCYGDCKVCEGCGCIVTDYEMIEDRYYCYSCFLVSSADY